MKTTVAILSRSHPEALTGVIMGLWRMRTERHHIEFRVGCDLDDDATMYAISRLGSEIPAQHLVMHAGPRSQTRGELDNLLLAYCRDADIITLLTDRTFCITPAWDEVLARAVTEKPNRPLWWSCPHDNVCAIPVIPKLWLTACDYKWSPEIFPFWFDDTWNQHIDLLIHGMPSLKVKASFSGQRGKTTRGRDFGFWIDVFNECLPLRITQAQEMAVKLNLPWQERRDVLLYFENWANGLKAKVAELETGFGDPRDPGPEYFEAKARAEKMLAAMKQAREEFKEEAA